MNTTTDGFIGPFVIISKATSKFAIDVYRNSWKDPF